MNWSGVADAIALYCPPVSLVSLALTCKGAYHSKLRFWIYKRMEQILFQIVRRYLGDLPDAVASEVTFFGSAVMLAFLGDEGQFVPGDVDMVCLLDKSLYYRGMKESRLIFPSDIPDYVHTKSFFSQFHDQIEFKDAYEQTSRLTYDTKVGRVKNKFDLVIIYTYHKDPFWMVLQSPCPICHLCFTKGKFNVTATAIETLRSRNVVIEPCTNISAKQIEVMRKYVTKGFSITIQIDISDFHDFRKMHDQDWVFRCKRFVKDNVVSFTLKE